MYVCMYIKRGEFWNWLISVVRMVDVMGRTWVFVVGLNIAKSIYSKFVHAHLFTIDFVINPKSYKTFLLL
ncbi:hypothetical protein HanRHA438_Chr11g0491141 [Helianthus annuus]|nr:hypothetical protein HanRHA438_Chr11g0491141 [Helianthus annuus]